MKTFYKVLANTLIAAITNNFVWFALTYWVYLETNSVLATSIVGGIYLVATALSGFWFGAIVDHNKKKSAMLISSLVSLLVFLIGFVAYTALNPTGVFADVANPWLWGFVVLLFSGVIVGNIRTIAVPTTVTLLVPEQDRDRANGLTGTVIGIAFSITSFASGIVLAYGGMRWVLLLSIVLTALAILHLLFIDIPEQKIVKTEGQSKGIDIKGTIAVVAVIPGLFGLIFFNMFNNFLGGVFMSLMDAYGLSLVSVQVWGVLWGVLSFAFIFGGMLVAKRGVGANPVRTLFTMNLVLWAISMFFAIQPWIWLLALSMFVYLALIPIIEASEQTIVQKVVPYERQGRVFGFAQSVEQAASPLTAFLIGPIAQFIFIPLMTTGAGVNLIGDWFGVGQGRGIALVFILTGFIGLLITVLAMRSQSYRLLSAKYQEGQRGVTQ